MARYIDAKKIEYIALPGYGLNHKQFAQKREIEKIPSADVEPVRHGHWIYEQYFGDYSLHVFKCSVCNRKISVNKKEEISDFPYCNCGAKMDERSDEDGEVH